ncbi:MAG: hypothetical protein JW932_20855 [Deltaproteobacteria bacterium]|nr:hypothetical protein [Deltaproteobacteria bacterium]
MQSLMEDLMDPAAFPDTTECIKLVQTHISMVYIGDSFVYKIKKPVNFGFLDFSSLEKRHYYCQQELNLNKRLAKTLYLDVLPVVFDGEKHKISLTGKNGDIVDYAVRMKKISERMLMKSLYERNELTAKHLEDLAHLLHQFHTTAMHSSEIAEFGKPDMFRINTDENFVQTQKYIDITINEKDFKSIKRWTDHFYLNNRETFFTRIKNNKIRDCHGDLHMEHISLEDPIAIFDCIEFNDRFRYTDTLADIAFLLMDLEYRNGKSFSDALWRYYSRISNDKEIALLTFYKVYRAYVRGKVISFQIDDPQISAEKKEDATQTAKRYFMLAKSYTTI